MKNKIVKIETIYGDLYSREDDLITDQLIRFSAHTRNELAMLKSVILPGHTILDIGAHIGTFSIPFALFVGNTGKIYSFEPNIENFKILSKNILENKLNDIIYPSNSIVSCLKNTFTAHITNPKNSGTYYFLPSAISQESDIAITHIDEWISEKAEKIIPDLIKIDVEGAELLVLQSCIKTISKSLPILYIEIVEDHLQKFNHSAQDIENLLKPLGYKFYKNIGSRNSNDDSFSPTQLSNIINGGRFFDLLAIHKSKDFKITK